MVKGSAPLNLTLEAAKRSSTTFLVPIMMTLEDVERYIAQHYAAVFEQQLSEWSMNLADWPKKRSLKLFREWFEVEVVDGAIDLSPEPLVREEG